MAIAKLRAVTMHARIPARSVHRKEAGDWPSAALAGTIQAHIDARIANGSAKIVWLKRMSSRNRRQRSHIFNRFPSVYPALIHLVRLSFISRACVQRSAIDRIRSPAFHQSMFDPEVIEDAGDDEIDEINRRVDTVVPTRHCGQHDRACLSGTMQVFQLEWRHGGFSRHQDQFAMFFQVNIRGALDQIVPCGVHDTGKGCSGTGADNHRFGEMATAGDWGHEIPVVMQFNACGALLDFGRRQRVPHAGLWRKIRFRGPVVR